MSRSVRVPKAEPCSHEDCGSRRFHEGDDGYTYCSQGHRQSERGTVVTEDTGELNIRGRTSKRKVGGESEGESENGRALSSFRGAQALEHYLLCLQLAIRKQLRWLVDVQKLPGELEVIVRDLWALLLKRCASRISNESDTEVDGHSQIYSSQSEGEATDSEGTRRSRWPSRSKAGTAPSMLDTLALHYIALVLLREPITIADLHAWASGGEILYYCTAREIPLHMRERLPPEYQELLEPQLVASPQQLHQAVLRVLSELHSTSGLTTPDINSPLIIYRWVRALALPIELIAATQRLARILLCDFAFVIVARRGGKGLLLRSPEVRLMALIVAATKLLFPFDDYVRHAYSASDMAALSINWTAWAAGRRTELDHKPHAKFASTPIPSLSFQEAMRISTTDAIELGDGQKLDAYLDWYEKNMASEDIREQGRPQKDAEFRRKLFKMFPASRSQERTGFRAANSDEDKVDKGPADAAESDGDRSVIAAGEPGRLDSETRRLRSVQALLQPNPVEERTGERESTLRIGSRYRRFRTVDALEEEGGPPVRTFYERAAEVVGVKLRVMVRAVFAMESRMVKYEEGEQKRERRQGRT